MMKIDGLRSPYDTVERLVHFGRMIDKIRLHAAGKLPAEYQSLLGGANPNGFDARCCRFLQVDYELLAAQAKKGGTEEELFRWACMQGHKPSGGEMEIWNAFMQKHGWRDECSARLRDRLMAELNGVHINGSMEHRLPGNLNVSFAGVDGQSLIMGLNNIAGSSGSAWTSASALAAQGHDRGGDLEEPPVVAVAAGQLQADG